MLREKNRKIERQRRQIVWLLIVIGIGSLWINSLKNDIENKESDVQELKLAIQYKDTLILNLQRKKDSLTSIIPVDSVKKVMIVPKKIKKDTTIKKVDTVKVVDTAKVISDSI